MFRLKDTSTNTYVGENLTPNVDEATAFPDLESARDGKRRAETTLGLYFKIERV